MSRPFLIEDEPFLLSSVMRLHTMEQATKQRQRIAGVLEAFEFQEPDRFAVQMAIEEALVNAVKHGNGCDPTKVVTFRCRITPALFRVEITDQGSGFVPNEVPDPRDEGNIELPCGRGLMLMRHYMDTVEYSEGGTQVTMERKLTLAPEPELMTA